MLKIEDESVNTSKNEDETERQFEQEFDEKLILKHEKTRLTSESQLTDNVETKSSSPLPISIDQSPLEEFNKQEVEKT